MAKENSDRDFDEERADLHARYVNGIATHYLKHAKKNKDDTFFDGRRITTTAGLVARAVITLVGDRTGADMLSIEKVERHDIQDIVEEIIAQGAAMDAVDSVYEKLQVLDPPSKDAKRSIPLSPVMGQIRETIAEASRQMHAEEVNHALNTAIQWGNREDLTPMERCHGVAYTLYKEYGMDGVTVSSGDKVIVDAGRTYAKSYDYEYADQIKAREIRAAKELFGGP